MTSGAPEGWSWTAAPLWRARMLAADLVRAAHGLATTARIARHEPPLRPGLAILEGPPIARLQTPSVYRIRVHNPGPEACTLALRVRGACADRGDTAFDLRATVAIAPAAAADRWLTTDWTATPRLDQTRPPSTPAIATDATVGRWWIEASIESPPGRLRVEGLVAA